MTLWFPNFKKDLVLGGKVTVRKLLTSPKSDVFYLKVEFSEMKYRVMKNHQGVTIFGQT